MLEVEQMYGRIYIYKRMYIQGLPLDKYASGTRNI